METMPDRTSTAKAPHEVAGDRLIEIAQRKTPAAESKSTSGEVPVAEVKKPRASLLESLGKLKPLLPILSGGLRMVDHGAVQALSHVIGMAAGAGAASSAAQKEHDQALAEIQSTHRELHLQVQDQTVEMQRIEDQLLLLRQTAERNAAEHTELVKNVTALSKLVRATGAGLAILLVILITLIILLLARHRL
jgi:hypothetical protein